jgi:autotransporter-associated beta strand protein
MKTIRPFLELACQQEQATPRQKPSRLPALRGSIAKLAAAALFLGVSSLPAAVVYWDTDGVAVGNNSATGAGLGGTGTWNLANLNWWDGSNIVSLTTWPATGTDTAVFTGTSGVVDLGPGITVRTVTFNTDGYSINGGGGGNTLTLTAGNAINVDVAGTATIDAIIAGSDGLTLNSTTTGRLVLTAANTYTGLTIVNTGTLTVAAFGSLNSGNDLTVNTGGTAIFDNFSQTLGTVNNSGTLSFTQDAATIEVGLVNNSGTMSFAGGTNTLGTVNNSLGATMTLAGGTNTLGAVNNGGTMNFTGVFATNTLTSLTGAGNANFSFGGTITGQFDTGTATFGWTATIGTAASGTLNLNGPGNIIQTLNGNPTVNLGLGPASIDGFDKNLTVDNGTQSAAGTINGPGNLIVTGALNLFGTNTYTGGTTLQGGTLGAGNTKAFGSGNLTLNSGTLKFVGGPRAVDLGAGNIAFNGGTMAFNIGGPIPGVNHDQIKTTGTFSTIGGTLALMQTGGYVLAAGDKINLILAAAGVAGGTATGTAVPDAKVTGLSAFSNSPLLVPTLTLYPTTVTLEAMQGSFLALINTLGFTPNQTAVARGLDSVIKNIGNRTGVSSEIDFLDNQSLSTLPGNLDKISPDELTSIFTNAIALANAQTDKLERRMEDIRAQAAAASASGMAAAGSGPSYSGGVNGPAGKRSKEIVPPSQERWGMFLTGSGEFTRVGSTTNAAGFKLETGGVTGGLDYRVSDHFAIGLDFGYVGTTASLANGGKIDTDGGRLGLYGTWFDRNFHVDAAVNGGLNSYKTRRTTPNNTAATGSPDGSEVNILVATGYDWKIGGLTVGPVASYQYTNVRMDGFTETGAFAPLAVNGQTVESSRTALGIRAYYETQVRGVNIRPEAKLAWQHEFGDSTYSITSSFATLGGNPFTVTGANIGRDSLLIGAGFSILWTPRFATYVYYDGEVCRTNYSSHSVSGGFRLQF